MSAPLDFIKELLLAVLLGSLIGVEREKNKQDQDLHDFGGIRTMMLSGLFGYLIAALFLENLLLFSIFTSAFVVLVLGSYIMTSVINRKTGATTELAALFVYLNGVLVAMGEVLSATILTLAVVSVLYFKETLHRFAKKLEKQELYSMIKFIAVAFVVLPLLPKETVDPLGVLSPYYLWLVVVLVSSISFLSYLGIKWLGSRDGIGLSGFLGGLMSSTAVAVSFSQMSRKTKQIVNPFVFGILIASSAMFFRVLGEVAILNQDLVQPLVLPMVTMGTLGLLFSAWFWFRGKEEHKQPVHEKDLRLKSPFQLLPALKFGILFAVILIVSQLTHRYLGDEGVLITAFLSGVLDVDAITVSMANLSSTGNVDMPTATLAIGIAAMANTLFKAVMVTFLASRAVFWRTVTCMVFLIGVGVLTFLIFPPSFYGLT